MLLFLCCRIFSTARRSSSTAILTIKTDACWRDMLRLIQGQSSCFSRRVTREVVRCDRPAATPTPFNKYTLLGCRSRNVNWRNFRKILNFEFWCILTSRETKQLTFPWRSRSPIPSCLAHSSAHFACSYLRRSRFSRIPTLSPFMHLF